MCGVPVERADDYLQRLIGLGHRVAVCEQTEDPAEAKKRGAKSVVRRDVVRLVTPGTITEDRLLEPGRGQPPRRGRPPQGLGRRAGAYGLAALDISTGRFALSRDRRRRARGRDRPPRAARDPRAGRRSSTIPELRDLWRETRGRRHAARPRRARSGRGRAAPAGFLRRRDARRFGAFSRAEIAAAGAALHYVEHTQIGSRPALEPPRREAAAGVLAIDAATRANLELTRTLAGERAGSLLATIDRTVTPGGARLLAERARRPARPTSTRSARGQDAVAFLVEDGGAARAPARRPRAARRTSPARCRGLALGRGGPRDLACLRDGLVAARSDSATCSAASRRSRPRSQPRRRGLAALDPGAAAGARGGARRRAAAQRARRRLRARRATSPRSTRRASCSRIRAASSPRSRPAMPPRPAAGPCASSTTTCSAISSRCRRRSARTFLRGAAEGRLRPPPDHGRRDAVLDRRARRAAKPDRLGGRPRAQDRARDLRRLVAARARCRGADRRRRRGARRGRRRGGARRARRSSRTGPGRRSTAASPSGSRAGATRWSRRRCSRDGVALHRQRLRPLGAAPDRPGASCLDHRPEHGRQVDLSAPERADRRARPDGRLRAGPRGAYRRRRPAVLARRRRRRPRPRALDLHGRDGRDGGDPQPGERALARHPRRDRPRHRDLRRALDRLGGDRASARGQPLPRPVRDAFPRAHRARRAPAAARRTRR